ncbi:hypothetical protein BO71DRAFT_434514 [Aspergillus ellipticus CBS 707.79]|uniref:Uncharacterized protein n=1 Tax=Aspergillus ellipticus CBS 707.79 TaxID=1448320 RepID=A0A319CWT2_9EURO|nr:hypothetical protein BO71DRAFT_434514 [Aspergillus ellipticus CBS 707.79]
MPVGQFVPRAAKPSPAIGRRASDKGKGKGKDSPEPRPEMQPALSAALYPSPNPFLHPSRATMPPHVRVIGSLNVDWVSETPRMPAAVWRSAPMWFSTRPRRPPGDCRWRCTVRSTI